MSRQGDSVIVVDAGGTSLKCTLVGLDELDGYPRERVVYEVPVDSGGPAESILAAFRTTLQAALRRAEQADVAVVGVSISTPGPFDLDRGVPLMEHKYRSIYGMNLREALRADLGLPREFPMQFLYDMDAFLIGEAFCGAARGYDRVVGITLGSGLGSSFMVGGRIVTSGEGIPPDGAIWCMPLGSGIVDDRLSHRGILSSCAALGCAVPAGGGVRYVADLAGSGDTAALRVFTDFGRLLGQVLAPIVRDFRSDCVVFGGQISKSFFLFADGLADELRATEAWSKLAPADNIDLAPLYGAARILVETAQVSSR